MALYEENELKIYNSISGEKEVFKPVHEGHVGMYVCGPTVYSYVHLGNCRTFISFDMVFRYLQHLGYKTRYVRNITDAGHLENDADEGEDKISQKARVEQIEPMEVVQKYTNYFHDILGKFNNIPPSIEPTATGHIIEQIEMIKKIIDEGMAYEINGSVYFDVEKYNKEHHYGKLSGRNVDELLSNTRSLDGQAEKRNPQDFALWKKASASHIMRWPSPWSDGFPGWHLECSAMSTKYLGEKFDIHGGGMDLKFPHHECEMAQNNVSNGCHAVSYWMHANMLTLNGKRMSKSTGNTLEPDELFSGSSELLDKAFAPAIVRFFIMMAHYRSNLDFSNDALLAAEKGYHRLMDAMGKLEGLAVSETSDFDAMAWKQKCYDAMNDDFNTPIMIAHLFDAVKFINSVHDKKAKVDAAALLTLQETFRAMVHDIMGVENILGADDSDKLDGVMQMLIKMRADARAEKNWALTDQIRDELKSIGIQLKDSKEGTSYSFEN